MTILLDGTAGLTAPAGTVYNGLAFGTVQSATSTSSIDFTGIPIWVKRVTVIFKGVSTNGSNGIFIQIGSGSIQSSGYISTSTTNGSGTSNSYGSSTSGFIIYYSSPSDSISGHAVITNISGNDWIQSHAAKASNAYTIHGGGDVSLSGTLDRVRVGSTETFDAGSVNIIWE